MIFSRYGLHDQCRRVSAQSLLSHKTRGCCLSRLMTAISRSVPHCWPFINDQEGELLHKATHCGPLHGKILGYRPSGG